MSHKLCEAVLNINSPTDFKQVLATAGAVVKALSDNSSVYTTPDPTLAALTAQINILTDLVNKVNDGDHSEIAARNEASVVLHSLLKSELIYVNKIGNHDRAVLIHSGFPVSVEPAPRPVPPQLIIKRIEDAKSPRTAKTFIERPGMKPLHYFVERTTTPADESSWKDAMDSSSSFKLIIHDMIHGQEVWFRVCAENVAGYGMWSVPVPFISQK